MDFDNDQGTLSVAYAVWAEWVDDPHQSAGVALGEF